MKKIFLKILDYIISTKRWTIMYKSIARKTYIEISQPDYLARADSFIVEKNQKIYIFFEEFVIEPDRKGYLCVGELDTERNELIGVQKILEKEYHLSYPYVFEYRNDWYMIPETHANRTIDLYHFKRFPYDVTKIRTLIDNIDAVDTTVLFLKETVYLFTNVKENDRSHNENLSLFYGDDLLNSDFVSHPCNPLKTDDRFSRMAGGIVKDNGQMFRYAQDCRISYGRQMYQYRIDHLSKTEYNETLIRELHPPIGYVASHTYSRSEHYEVIDAIKKENITGMIQNIFKLIIIIPGKIWKNAS